MQDLKNNDNHMWCFTAKSFPECVRKQQLLASQLTIVHKPPFTMHPDYVFQYILKSPRHFMIQVTVKKLEATSYKASSKPYTELRWDKQRKHKLDKEQKLYQTSCQYCYKNVHQVIHTEVPADNNIRQPVDSF